MHSKNIVHRDIKPENLLDSCVKKKNKNFFIFRILIGNFENYRFWMISVKYYYYY